MLVNLKNGAGFTLFRDKFLTGFTLLEVMVAIFLITLGIGGAVTLINQTISATQITSQKLVASYLAQEGIEIVKNIRDSNFLEIHKTGTGNWIDGLTGCDSGCEADFSDDSLAVFGSRYLKIDGGFYNYELGTDTAFKRKILIQPGGVDILKVLVEISWQERGRSHKVIAQENLYKWWQ